MNGLAGDLIKIGDYKKLAHLINNYYRNKKNITKKIKIGVKNFKRFDYQMNCKKYLNFVVLTPITLPSRFSFAGPDSKYAVRLF